MRVLPAGLRVYVFSAVASILAAVPIVTLHAQQVPQTAAKTRTVELPYTSHDGYEMFGKLTLPEAGGPAPVVIYVQTAEGMTVEMRRPNGRGGTFNYFDLYAAKLPEMHVGFFRYEGRGVRMGDQPPRYEKIDWEIYNTSSLENKVRDILTAIKVAQKQPGAAPSRIYLMGASEGTLLAAEAAARAPQDVRGLILYGVMSGNMRDTFKYIVSDGGFLSYRGFFDTDKDGRISKAEFEADPRKYREVVFKNAPFEQFDRNSDGYFTVEDMRLMSKPLLDAVDNNNFEVLDRWTKSSAGVSTPANWFKDHFAHPTIWTFLSKLDIPIGFFQGDRDTAASIEGVKKLEADAKAAGKKNMRFFYFEGLDHSLGIGIYFIRGTLPAGHTAIFEFINNLANAK